MLENKKIFIECSPGVGDLVVLSPIVKALKEKYPTCELTIMSKRNSLRVIERLPYVDHICPMDEGVWKIINCIRKQDYVIFFNYKLLFFIAAKLCMVPNRIGPCKDKHKKWKVCTQYFPYDESVPLGMHQSDYFMQHICQALNIPELIYGTRTEVSQATTKEWNVAEEKMVLSGHRKEMEYICISPFANTALDISLSKIKPIVEGLLADYKYEIIFLDIKHNLALDRMIDDIGSNRLINMSGETTMSDMLALLGKARLMVCSDSGPMHIACALGIPTVAVFSTAEVARWAPRDSCYPVSLNLSCSPCKAGRHKCKEKRCMRDIPVSMIERKIDIILNVDKV